MVLFVAIGMTTSSVFAAETYDITKGKTVEGILLDTWDNVVQLFSIVDEGSTFNFFGEDTWENVTLTINKAINFIGNGVTLKNELNDTIMFDITRNNVLIDGFNMIGNRTIRGVDIDNLVLQNLNLTGTNSIGASSSGKDGIDIRGDNNNNIIIDNVNINGTFRRGISIQSLEGLIINNTIVDGFITQNAIGINKGGNVQILNSELFGNDNAEFGVHISGEAYNITYTNLNISNFIYAGISLEDAGVGHQIITDSNIFNNPIAIYLKEVYNNPLKFDLNDLIIKGNSINGNNIGGLYFDNILNYEVDINKLLKDNNMDNNGILLYNKYSSSNILVSYSPEKTKPTPEPTPALSENLSISSSISKNTVKNGDKLVYTITVKNTGNKASDAISVDTGIPSTHATISSHYVSGTLSNGKWNIASLGAGDTAVLVLEVSTKKSGSTNIVSTLNSGSNKLQTGTNKLTINKDIKLSTVNKVSTPKAKIGKEFNLATTVKNDGNDKSDKVTVKIAVPKGVKVSSVNNKAKYNSKNKQWAVEVNSKSSVKLSMKLKATTKGTKNIVFTVNGKKQTKRVKIV